MTTECRGWELEAGDHRVLGQLSRLTKAASGRISSGDPKRLAQRLHMDESAWRDAIVELRHSGFVEEVEGLLYLNTRCLCAQGEGLPPIGAKERETLQPGPVKSQGWRRLPPARNEPQPRPPRRRRAEGARRDPPVGGVSRLGPVTEATVRDTDALLFPGAKPLRKGRIKPRDITSEPSAKSVTNLATLRSAFKEKFVASKIIETLKLPAIHVLDNPADRAFIGALKRLRDDEGFSYDEILAMMDAFMAMVLSRGINIDGHHVWRVFIGNRRQCYERARRDAKLGDASGKFQRAASHNDQRLDWIRGGVVEPGSPNNETNRGER